MTRAVQGVRSTAGVSQGWRCPHCRSLRDRQGGRSNFFFCKGDSDSSLPRELPLAYTQRAKSSLATPSAGRRTSQAGVTTHALPGAPWGCARPLTGAPGFDLPSPWESV